MQAFYNLKIATKLILTFFVVLILTTFLGLFSIRQLHVVNDAANEIGNDWMPSSIAAMGMKESVSRMRSQEAQMASSENADEAKKYQERTNEAVTAFKKYFESSQKYADTPSEKKALEELQAAFNEYNGISQKIASAAIDGKSQDAVQILRGDSSKSNKKMREMIDKIVEAHVDGGVKAFTESAVTFSTARNMIIGVMIVSVVLGVILALWIAKIIASPLQRAVDIAQTIAAGDLTQHIESESSCETGQLMQALADMNSSLLNVVSQVHSGTTQISHAATEIANGNLSLSQRTEEQASSLEETASSMEEITSTVKHNSDNARQANVLSQSATAIAEKGGSVVSEVVATMSSINESSRKIVDIISVIDGIAFQTNILALNAAVEAARAGEQGRGFAVVASEVRSLAQRSASAAKEIKELINDSVEKVAQGSRLVDGAGSTMQEVVESVKRVSDIISEITAASTEQSSGIEQINQAITQMDSVTQQNAALVEEAAAAAATMQEQASQLVEVVDVFKLSQQAPRATPVASPVPSRTAARPAKAQPARISAAPAAKIKKSEPEANKDDWEEF